MKIILKCACCFPFLLFLFSCSYGVPDGADLAGKWTNMITQATEAYRFYADGTGYYEKKHEIIGQPVTRDSIDFTWELVNTEPYKKIKIHSSADYTYEYYFSAGKNWLYLHDVNQCCFQGFYKYRE